MLMSVHIILQKLVKFWLDKGIGGFRVDAPIFYMEDPYLRDEPLTNPNKTDIHNFLDLWHQYTVNLPESNEFTRKLYTYIKKYSKEKGDYERYCIPKYAQIKLERTHLIVLFT